KCKKEFLTHFKDLGEIIAVRVEGEPYPEETDVIMKIGADIGLNIANKEDLFEALHYIKDKNSRVVICGSLHLNRDVKKLSKA
ncbi:MAG: hypothetical protein ISQ34_03325, partial [Rickettsiales bacterium]|nr:hypothetical protein [Rickettsiales bacterium]